MLQNATVRKAIVYTGIAALWIGGFAVCYGVGQLVGNVTGKVALKGTEALLKKI
jgi:hypothetical protein